MGFRDGPLMYYRCHKWLSFILLKLWGPVFELVGEPGRVNTPPSGDDALTAKPSSFAQPIVVVLDSRGEILYVNEAWPNFCQDGAESPAPENWIGRNYLEIAQEAQLEEDGEGLLVSAALKDLLAGKRRKFEIVYACARSESRRWFKMLCRAVSSTPQVKAVVMLIDVTESFLGEQTVREHEERLCSLIEEGDDDNLDGAAIEAMVTASRVLDAMKSRNTVRLSPRETECLLWTAYGLRSKEISGKIGITTKTVEHHLARAKKKLASKNRVETVTRAIALGLIQP